MNNGKSQNLETLKLIAIDLDGPLLVDTFAPLLRLACQYYGLEYSRERESNVLSRSREQAVQYMKAQLSGTLPDMQDKSDAELTESFFRFRAEYLKENPLRLAEGAENFLVMLAGLDIRLVCYGGLDENYMRRELGGHAALFERYVCTNDFRPGVAEIVHDICAVAPSEALFIDDVNFAAIHARRVGAAFIGVPSEAEWSWQKREMQESGVPFIVNNAAHIDMEMLQAVDRRLASGGFWSL
jgi:beta-phosphoglucomutase-like phosphatase (HAD superfamily)